MAEPMVLLYNFDASEEASIRGICGEFGMGLRAVAPPEYALPLGALAGIPVSGAPSGLPGGGFGEQMLVMCFLSRPQMDAFLNRLRAAGAATAALKAVLTPTNVSWSSAQLHRELCRERDAINRRSR